MAESPLTQEELDALAANPESLSDELEARLDAQLQAGPDAPVAPPPETPEVPTSPSTSPAPEETKSPPSYFEDIPPEQRRTVMEAWWNGMSEEERKGFAPISQLVRDAESRAEQRGEQRGRAGAVAEDFDARLGKAEQTALDDPSLANLKAYATSAEERAYAARDEAMAGGLSNVVSRFKLGDVPSEVRQRVSATDDVGKQIEHYVDWIARSAFAAGEHSGKQTGATMSEAEKIVTTARLRNEAIAQAAKDGRIKITLGDNDRELFAEFVQDRTPPVLSGVQSSPASSGLSDDEWARYQRLAQTNPEAIPDELSEKVERALAQGMAAQR